MLKIHPFNPLSGSACENSKQRLRIYPEGFRQLADGTEVGFYVVALDSNNSVDSYAGFFCEVLLGQELSGARRFQLVADVYHDGMVPQTSLCHHPTEMVSKKCVYGGYMV
jgi:hypothetical protein